MGEFYFTLGHSWITQCTYLCITNVPVIATDGTPLALKENLNTTLNR